MPDPRCHPRRWQAWLAATLYLWSLLHLVAVAPGLLASQDPLAVLEICTGDGQLTRVGADGLPVPAHRSGHQHCPGCLPGCSKTPAMLAMVLAVPAPGLVPQIVVRAETTSPAPTGEAWRHPPVRGPPTLV